MKIVSCLALVLIVEMVQAVYYITAPVQSTSWNVGQQQTITWITQAPVSHKLLHQRLGFEHSQFNYN